MLIFGLLVYVMLPQLLLVSLYAAEEKGFPQAQGLLVRGGGVIPYGCRDCVGWTVAVAVSLHLCSLTSLVCLGGREDSAPLWPRDSLWLNPFCLCPWLLWHLEEDEKRFKPWIEAIS